MREPAAQDDRPDVLIIAVVVVCLYLIYLVRKPIGWLLIATFLAIALSGPGQRADAAHEAGLRDRRRLHRAAPRPDRPDRVDRAAVHHRGQRPGRERAASTRAT